MAATTEPRAQALHFWVKTELVVGGRMQSPSVGVGAALRDLPIGQAPAPPQQGDVTRFLLAGWVGGGNPAFSVAPIGGDGVARVRLLLREGDPDTVKLSVSFNMVAPKGQRNCHLASSFLGVPDLLALLRESPRAGPGPAPRFTAGQRCFSMRDNFTKNAAVLRFANADTDVASAACLGLRASALRSLDRTNAAVLGLGQRLKAQIATFAVSPLNAGPQYMEAFSYLQMQNCLVHYAILGHVFDRLTSPVQLPWLMYDAYQAAHLSGVHPAALAALPDVPFVLRFGQPLVTAHTACGLSSIYCTDYTVNACDVACKLRETEDMAKTFGCLSLQSQAGLEGGADGPPPRAYAPSRAGPPPPLAQCVEGLLGAQRARRERGLARRVSYACLCDDCENASMGIMMKARGLMGLYRAVMGAVLGGAGLGAGLPPPAAEEEGARRLADAMAHAQAAGGEPWGRLFAALTRQDHLAMAGPLLRLGGMLHRGDWATAFTVVSAKGPSYTDACPDAPGALSGHGTVVGRIRSGGRAFHGPLEGTTHMCQDPPVPPTAADCVRARLEDGSVAAFDHSEFATVFAQNVHRAAGASPDYCALAHIRADYGDAPQRCPFYVSAFYTGLSEGGAGSLGCVPLDTKPPASFGAGSQPVFGAPVMGLSHPSTMAVPITAAMLAPDAADPRPVTDLLHALMQEAYCPEASQETVAAIASYWQPVSPLRSDFECAPGRGAPFVRRRGFEATMRSLNTWAFDDPAHADMAVKLYGALATRFNVLQSQDPGGDGVTAAAFGHYLSAALRFDIPMRPAGGDSPPLSTFRNLRQAVADVGLAPLAACPLKMAAIGARARVRTDAHFYMCDQGEGPVHAHRVRLA